MRSRWCLLPEVNKLEMTIQLKDGNLVECEIFDKTAAVLKLRS